ncbi:hypothetical protein ABFS83_12G069500 [Erythranthe nasuta]
MEALNFSMHGTVTVKNPVTPMKCSSMQETHYLVKPLEKSPFTISGQYNSLAVLGCQNSVWLRANATATVGGCMAICDGNSTDNSCNGVNCCQTTIPPRVQELKYTYQGIQASIFNSTCGYAFPVENKWFQEDYKSYKGLQSNLSNPFDQEFEYAPLVLEWELDNHEFSPHASCTYSKSSSYRSSISGENYISSLKYCSCGYGYEGNPYIPEGCTDIDECANASLNHCINGTCINLIGSYTCQFDYNRNGSGRSQFKLASISSLGSGLGALILLVGAWRTMEVIRKIIESNRKHKFFKRNGGLLLKQQLSYNNDGLLKTKLFSSKELAQATDHYNENRVLGRGGQGTVYKGMLTDGNIVAVKKSKRVDERNLEFFINEVVILSQINHRNVVKLLGCSLEMEVPSRLRVHSQWYTFPTYPQSKRGVSVILENACPSSQRCSRSTFVLALCFNCTYLPSRYQVKKYTTR